LLQASTGQAEPARIQVTFQPDCYRTASNAPCERQNKDRLDPGPQIAVWIESATGSRFIDTILVTNLTAVFGIGNRVGYWALPSGPKFPYGKRVMALPVWAHRRGKLYENLVNQAGVNQEFSIGGLEPFSSPEPYFCRPLEAAEVVDAISCPTPMFDSAKGRFFDPLKDLALEHRDERGNPFPYVPPAKSHYPPRNELRSFTVNDCDDLSEREGCPIAARRFADINDLDAVAASTPPYGRPYTRTWFVPEQVPDGDYLLFLEVNKEYDTNSSHAYAARADHLLEGFGILTNFGQPSVVFRVPFRLDRTRTTQAAVTSINGYGDWDGASGTLHAPDRTISDSYGSGTGRLMVISQPALVGSRPLLGRVHVLAGPLGPDAGGAMEPIDAGSGAEPGPSRDAAAEAGRAVACPQPLSVQIPAIDVPTVAAERAELVLLEPSGPDWEMVSEYEGRYWNEIEMSEDAFQQGTPLAVIPRTGPGRRISVAIPNLKERSRYTVGVRAVGNCLATPVSFASFETPPREFKQLSGCFIATAAWGAWSPQSLQRLRRARDWLRTRSLAVALLDEIYAQSSPPTAAALAISPPARAAVRSALRALFTLFGD
jgi:hypothetical protein